MEHPLCRLCGSRHAGNDHVWAVAPEKKIAVEKTALRKEPPKPIVTTSEKLIERVAAAVASEGCPVCAERKAKHAARMKRWREKGKKK